MQLTGLGTPNQMRAVRQGRHRQGFALWNPADLGYLAAYAAARSPPASIDRKQVDKFKAGKLGELTIGERDGVR